MKFVPWSGKRSLDVGQGPACDVQHALLQTPDPVLGEDRLRIKNIAPGSTVGVTLSERFGGQDAIIIFCRKLGGDVHTLDIALPDFAVGRELVVTGVSAGHLSQRMRCTPSRGVNEYTFFEPVEDRTHT